MRFLVLGPLEVIGDDGRPVAIAGSKERTVLACLVSHAGHVVSIDALVDELWGEAPPRTAERTLGSYISRVRRAMAADVIRARGEGYALEVDGDVVDAVAFERLAADGRGELARGDAGRAASTLASALRLWRGVAYQDFRGTRFGAAEGDRLEELRRTALEDLVDARLAAGEAAPLVADLESMVHEEPLRERRWGQLMLALYRSGRQAEALQAYTRARSVLVEELAVEPGPALRHLQAAILAQDVELAAPVAGHPPRPDVCPYKGLARFEPDDAPYFFGREQLVSDAVAHLVGARFLALVGASGSGKSSLLRAGVLHALGSGAIPGSERWRVTVMRPGDRPTDALRRALDGASPAGPRSILAIDQFEEVFTACRGEAERVRFLDAITALAFEPEGGATVVLAMRADLYGRCASHRPLASLLASHQILVGPMDGSELRRAIERPAERAGLEVERELTDALLRDTVGRPGALPLLSTALLELWTRRRDGTLTLDAYRASGGVQGAVARIAEDAFARLDDAGRTAARRILLRLAEIDEGGAVVRRRVPLSEFDLDGDAGAEAALDALADARLISVAEGTAEVAHEALLREWPRLRSWLDEDAEGRRLHVHLTTSSHAWDEGGRDPADLYRGARLAAALEWARGDDAAPNALERRFLDASRALAEGESTRVRRTNRRLRTLLVGVALLLAVSLLVGNVALRQRDVATDALAAADAGRLASRSRVEEDPTLALLMAREAVHIRDTAETRGALFAALERTPAITGRMYAAGGPSPAGDETQWIAISPDGRVVAIGDAGATVSLFDAVADRPLGSIDVGAGTDRAAFAADGRTLVVATSEHDLVSIDVASRTERSRVAATGPVDALAVSPVTGTLVSAEATRGRVTLVPRDPLGLEPAGSPVPTPGKDVFRWPPLAPFAMAFSPDGSLVTTRREGPTIRWSDALEPIRRFPDGGDAVAVAPDGTTAALLENDDAHLTGDVSLLDLRTGDVRAGTGGHHGTFISRYEAAGLSFTPDGRAVVTVGNDGRMLIWDAASASVRETFAPSASLPLRGPAVSPDGSTLFTTDRNRDVVVWDLSGRHRVDRPFRAGAGFEQWPYFAISLDGDTIAVPSAPGPAFARSGSIELLRTADLTVARTIAFPNASPMALAFAPDPRTLAVASFRCFVDDGGGCHGNRSSVRVWDVASGRPTTPVFPGVPRGTQIFSLAFSPDGNTLVGGGASYRDGVGRVWVWDARARRLLETFDVGVREVNQVTFTPDGSLLVVAQGFGDGGTVVFWDTETHRVVGWFRGDDAGVFGLDIARDGRTLATAGQTAGVRLWDLSNLLSVAARGASFTGLSAIANTVDVSADGGRLVGADVAGTVVLWDVATSSQLGDPLPGPNAAEVVAASFTPDGRRVVVVSDSGAGWVWDVDARDWEARACAVAGRSMTRQEWDELLPDRPYHATCGS
jgi:DNA-binding SARP family transcriptional activator/WD40 repeat protein